MTLFAGIDLGAHGALVVLTETGRLHCAHRMPLTSGVPDIAAAKAIVASLPHPLIVTSEAPVKVLRGGTSDSGYTALCASLKFWRAAFGKTPIATVQPQVWQSAICGCVQGVGKAKAINWCRTFLQELDLYPGRCTSPYDGLSDAACVAEYGRRAATASRQPK